MLLDPASAGAAAGSEVVTDVEQPPPAQGGALTRTVSRRSAKLTQSAMLAGAWAKGTRDVSCTEAGLRCAMWLSLPLLVGPSLHPPDIAFYTPLHAAHISDLPLYLCCECILYRVE